MMAKPKPTFPDAIISEILRLYVDDCMSANAISKLVSSGNITITGGQVLTVLRNCGVAVRDRGEATRTRTDMRMRLCKHCNEPFQAVSQQAYCKTCVPDRPAYCRLINYGLANPDLELLWQQQNGTCALCPMLLHTKTRHGMNVDHCHETGLVRGLLCHRCNIIVGLLDKDDWIDNLNKITAYVRRETP